MIRAKAERDPFSHEARGGGSTLSCLGLRVDGVWPALSSLWKRRWGFAGGDGGKGVVGRENSMCKGTGLGKTLRVGEAYVPPSSSLILSHFLPPCFHPKPLQSIVQTEAASKEAFKNTKYKNVFKKCKSDHASLSLLKKNPSVISSPTWKKKSKHLSTSN